MASTVLGWHRLWIVTVILYGVAIVLLGSTGFPTEADLNRRWADDLLKVAALFEG